MGDENADTNLAMRADARRNRTRVLDGAREAFAKYGFNASYHQIAQLAGVGVGTVYRRFPDRDILIEAALLDIFAELTSDASSVIGEDDAWAAFQRFFRTLADRMHRHAGLSAHMDRMSGKVETACVQLLDAIDELCRLAAFDLRPGIGYKDVIFLARASCSEDCGLGIILTEERRQHAVAIILDGLRRNV